MVVVKDNFRFKQVIVVRSDIKMGKGKVAAQVAHASVDAVLKTKEKNPEWLSNWIDEGQVKIVVKADTEQDLVKLKMQAESLGIQASLIVDRGLTQVEPNTVTTLGIGPAPAALVDKLTGKLKLL
ncbi:MAG: peptidyl-tRNA hydrolase Pth2 [Conexivisphaerales archaeon]